ncbi:uncharacterized protein LOC128881327 [Hylaeus volcanicus]|uniref:uncharacterized protein LOC128881327 n=1 Tax=Hylaeus volcanicus TaxID=313075 RepID=UPI0023B85F81|nr:uncharacterized protein LOC128881327 [Hylaeus volcanicus]
MSLCLRTLPNKFTSFVNTRKQVTKINRHLPKHVKSSLFEEATSCTTINSGARSLNPTIHLLGQYVPLTNIKTYTEQSQILNRNCNCNQQQTAWLKQQRQRNSRTLDTINNNFTNNSVLNNDTRWSKSHTDTEYIHKNKKSCLLPIDMVALKKSVDNSSSNSGKQGILYTEFSPKVQNVNENQPSEDRKPSEEQLQYAFDTLSKDLPMLFVKTMDYTLYTNDIIFINNIKGTTTTGLVNYIKQIAMVKIVGHIKFAFVKLEIIKITMHPEDNSIKVRWRIIGVSGTHIFLTFWKLKIWKIKSYLKDRQSWYDGFSTFYVNNDGKIFKHVVDKMMPDIDSCEKIKTPVEAKLALFTALLGLDSYTFTEFCSKLKSHITQIK